MFYKLTGLQAVKHFPNNDIVTRNQCVKDEIERSKTKYEEAELGTAQNTSERRNFVFRTFFRIDIGRQCAFFRNFCRRLRSSHVRIEETVDDEHGYTNKTVN